MHQLGVMHYLGEAATDDDQATNEAVRWFRIRRRSTVCILAAPWATAVRCQQSAVSSQLSARVSYLLRTD